METSDSITLKNEGNAPAKFFWECETKAFQVEPISGEVPPNNGTIECRITYVPSVNAEKHKEQPGKDARTDEEKLILNTVDGLPQTVRCIGVVNEAKCILK